jgi:hypothetical protein
MFLNSETIELQEKLALYCRIGIYTKLEGVDENRVAHYRRLVLNNINNTLKQAYPITQEWLTKAEWEVLVQSFFKEHFSQTPKIWEMPKEFMEYVKDKKLAIQLDKPALNDLLLFEWFEIEVHTMPDKEVFFEKEDGNYLKDTAVLNPHYLLHKLDYPVHIFNADNAVAKKGDWFIYLFRHPDTGAVQFLNISALHVFVLEKLYDEPQPLVKVLPLISSVFALHDVDNLKQRIVQFFIDLQKKGAIQGFM